MELRETVSSWRTVLVTIVTMAMLGSSIATACSHVSSGLIEGRIEISGAHAHSHDFDASETAGRDFSPDHPLSHNSADHSHDVAAFPAGMFHVSTSLFKTWRSSEQSGAPVTQLFKIHRPPRPLLIA